MLWSLSWDDENWWSMFLTWGIHFHAQTVVMRRWQLTEPVSHMNDILPCSDLCHKTMTTDGAWFMPEGYITMAYPLSWDDDNWRSMNRTWEIYYHALTVVMRRSQLTEHVSFINDLLPCSDRYHETMTTEGAFFIHEWYITMLWPLSWEDDKWRSMIHILEIYYHALRERCH